MTPSTRTGIQPSSRSETLAQLQSLRFRLMTELGRGATPMRLVNEAFERTVRELSGEYAGNSLVLMVERAVREEFAPTPKLVEVA